MLSRTRNSTITFRHPFTLAGADKVLAAGTYLVETQEELLQSLSFPAYRRIGTWIRRAPDDGSPAYSPLIGVEPQELAAALAADAAAVWPPAEEKP